MLSCAEASVHSESHYLHSYSYTATDPVAYFVWQVGVTAFSVWCWVKP